jgi:hypothetical protein
MARRFANRAMADLDRLLKGPERWARLSWLCVSPPGFLRPWTTPRKPRPFSSRTHVPAGRWRPPQEPGIPRRDPVVAASDRYWSSAILCTGRHGMLPNRSYRNPKVSAETPEESVKLSNPQCLRSKCGRRTAPLFASANPINETPPGNFRNKATLICRDAVVHPSAVHHLSGRLIGIKVQPCDLAQKSYRCSGAESS